MSEQILMSDTLDLQGLPQNTRTDVSILHQLAIQEDQEVDDLENGVSFNSKQHDC